MRFFKEGHSPTEEPSEAQETYWQVTIIKALSGELDLFYTFAADTSTAEQKARSRGKLESGDQVLAIFNPIEQRPSVVNEYLAYLKPLRASRRKKK